MSPKLAPVYKAFLRVDFLVFCGTVLDGPKKGEKRMFHRKIMDFLDSDRKGTDLVIRLMSGPKAPKSGLSGIENSDGGYRKS